MKRVVAALCTLVIVAGIVRWKSSDIAPAQSAPSPRDCVQTMFEAASQGNLERYLACFAAGERERLSREFAGQSAAAASEGLRRSVADLKGWALLDPPAETSTDFCSLTVEWVYATRVDRQRLELERDADGWRIVRAERVQPVQPSTPYGTPVYGPAPASN